MGKWRYGVIIDAGSSGTRVHIFRWSDYEVARQEAKNGELHRLPFLETHNKWTKKIHPGISSFAETPGFVGPSHLQHLLDHALEIIPKNSVRETPIFLLATAGVRLLPKLQQSELLRHICAHVKANTHFLLPDCDLHVQVISGQTEGLYGWIASNYLLGGFDAPEEHNHGKGHHTYGLLELGGASAQIAFAPNTTEAEKHANDLKLLRLRALDGQDMEYQVFVTTWLGFGVNAARKTYVTSLLKANSGNRNHELPDPCLPSGVKLTRNGTLLSDLAHAPSNEPHLLGTGRFEDCLQATYPILDKDASCEDEPCLFHGVHTPAIDFDVNHFIGISEYWHTTHDVFDMGHQDKSYDFTSYQQRVSRFCGQSWASIQAEISREDGKKTFGEQTAYEVCFKASWLINMLHSGIGVPREGLESNNRDRSNGTREAMEDGRQTEFLEPFQAVKKIRHTEVSWTLGKMVLYAASQVPPIDEHSLPVGFGSNEPGIPIDFERPGGATHPNSTIAKTEDETITTDTYNPVYDSKSRRVPGLLLFALIFFMFSLYLCGRGRQSRLCFRIFGGNGKKRRPFSAKLPFLSRTQGPSYERVLEDGEALGNASAFELGDAESDDSEKQQDAGPSGWGTSRKRPQADLMHADMMDRSGLAVRTESRERLVLDSGRKSRTGSPSRLHGSLGLTASTV